MGDLNIKLKYNAIKYFPELLFENHKSIKNFKIDLSNNQIKKFKVEKLFTHIEKVEDLNIDLQGNNIQEIS